MIKIGTKLNSKCTRSHHFIHLLGIFLLGGPLPLHGKGEKHPSHTCPLPWLNFTSGPTIGGSQELFKWFNMLAVKV